MIKPYLTLIYLGLALALATTLWFSGVHHGKNISDAVCNVERLSVATATNTELVRLKKLAEKLAAQLNEADDARDAAAAQLARIHAIAHAHVVCHAAPASSSGGALPGFPATAIGGATGSRPLPPYTDFDPSERLYGEIADSCDNTVEKFRDVLNRWPH